MEKKNHLYRTLIILAAVVVAAINFYPTAGWYGSLEKKQRIERSEQFNQEDRERAGVDSGMFQEMQWGFKRWLDYDDEWLITPGLDLQGGIHIVVGFDDDNEEAVERGLTTEQIQEMVLQRIRLRIEEFESKEPIIQKLGTNQIQIQLPGEEDVERAKKIIFDAGVMNFHIAAEYDDPQDQTDTIDVLKLINEEYNKGFIPFLEAPVYNSNFFGVTQENYPLVKEMVDNATSIPADKIVRFSAPPPEYDLELDYLIYVLNAEVGVSGEMITEASAAPDPESPGSWMILFDFNSEGAKAFGELTANNVNRSLAIVLDGKVMSAPNIREKIMGGSGNISGQFTPEQAQNVAIALNSGSMPVKLREDYAGIVGPTIGGESASKGITSSLIGLGLVMAFMLFYYRSAGLIANISLLINAILIMGSFAYFGTTLTLPGIAGLILTIGMAVDANVLIFERIREEAKLGKSLQHCVEGGYARAASAIWDANITTLIAAVVLTQFGTGPVKGFAVALCIGVCTSVFAALVVSRALLEFIAERQLLEKFSMASILKGEPEFQFMSKRKVALVFSIVIIAIGMGNFAMRGQGNFGVDFTNGTNMQVSIKADSEIPVDDVRAILSTDGFNSPIVQEVSDTESTDNNRFLIRISADSEDASVEENDEDGQPGSVSEDVQASLVSLSTVESDNVNDKVEILEAKTVGPAVGKQLRGDALNAIFFALFFIIVYLWARFELKYAIGAAVALLHDVIVVVGIMSILGREISIPVVAAWLTIIGYSLNDTIVVFDRVREDLALSKTRGLNFVEMVNLSLNRTLSRTLLTSVTTFFVVLILCVFGGPAIFDFALALCIGVVVGTYSSIFVATPTVNFLHNREEKKAAALEESEKR